MPAIWDKLQRLTSILTSQRGEAGDPDEPPNDDANPSLEGADQPPQPPQPAVEDRLSKLEGLLGTMGERFGTLETSLRAISDVRRDVQPPPIDDEPQLPSMEELEQALLDGKGAAKLLQAADLLAERKIRKLREESLDPAISQSTSAVASLAKDAAAAKMPHYKRFQREIDQYIDQLPPNLRLRPETYKIAHDAIVGSHVDDLVREEREKVLREGAGGGATTPGSATGRDHGTKTIPTVRELLGEGAEQALTSTGKTPDSFAKSMGYESWADYAEKRILAKPPEGEGDRGKRPAQKGH